MDSNNKKCIAKNITINKNRIGYFDVLRGIGVLLMIMGHVTFGNTFNVYIHAFHMPIFFFVSGYFFNFDKYNNVLTFVIHKLKTLLIPYTVFVLLCQVLHYIYTGSFELSYFLLSYFSSNHNRIDVIGALWFLPCLFSAEILFCLVNKIFRRNYIQFLVIIVITIIGNCTPVKFPFCIDSAMSCMLLMYLGYILKLYSNSKVSGKILNMNSILLILLFLVNIIFILENGIVNIRTNDFSNILLYWLNCICAITIYVNISKKIDTSSNGLIRFISNKLKYVGQNSLIYLLLNELMIFVTGSMLKLGRIEQLFGGTVSFYIYQILLLAICMILLYVATEIINKSFLKVFLGKF